MISPDDAAFLACYDVDADDPAAPELLQKVGNQVAAFRIAFLEIGPEKFFRHLGIQIARTHADLDKARCDLRLLREFHAPSANSFSETGGKQSIKKAQSHHAAGSRRNLRSRKWRSHLSLPGYLAARLPGALISTQRISATACSVHTTASKGDTYTIHVDLDTSDRLPAFEVLDADGDPIKNLFPTWQDAADTVIAALRSPSGIAT